MSRGGRQRLGFGNIEHRSVCDAAPNRLRRCGGVWKTPVCMTSADCNRARARLNGKRRKAVYQQIGRVMRCGKADPETHSVIALAFARVDRGRDAHHCARKHRTVRAAFPHTAPASGV
jgi:hypothetical protein